MCSGPVVAISDRRIYSLVVVKEGTDANTVPNPDRETKVDVMNIDNEFSDLSMDDTTQESEFVRGNNYPSVIGTPKKKLIFWQETFSPNSTVLDINDKGYKIPSESYGCQL